MPKLHEFEMESITGESVSFDRFAGKAALVVNVASECGLTPQYAGLRTLHEERDDLNVLGFPCNQFGTQEPGSNDEVREFATSKYDVNFPMFAKVEVNGDGAAPLYEWLREAAPQPDGKAELPWNFTKFLVDAEGNVVKRYDPKTTPEEIGRDLDQALGKA